MTEQILERIKKLEEEIKRLPIDNKEKEYLLEKLEKIKNAKDEEREYLYKELVGDVLIKVIALYLAKELQKDG